ncbi:MAG: hypothetical protein E7164_00425 [Firmicutes bacterium]|nr:hypothetical protein [Bacillota bacterium]
MEQKIKEFDLGVILTITTGRLFAHYDEIYDVLNYLTGGTIHTHQMPRVSEIAKNYVLSLHPELKGVGLYTVINTWDDVKAFVDIQKEIFGEKIALSPMSNSDGYVYVDPKDEASELMSNKRK